MNPYELITNRIIEKLKQGVVPWHQPWASVGLPKNLLTQREYRGMNVFMLAMQGYNSPYWLTYQQAISLGANVKKGEKGTPIIYWNWVEKDDEKSEEQEVKRVPFLRFYTVFNVCQVENLKVTESLLYPIKQTSDFNPITEAEKIVVGYKGAPEIIHTGERACYFPHIDKIWMPPKNTFEDPHGYYSTIFHEMSHSTGHKDRLNREGVVERNSFRSHKYSKEELVAEMGAAFLCGESAIINETLDNSTSYIASWLRI
jgi:antirestriction protein ArdC